MIEPSPATPTVRSRAQPDAAREAATRAPGRLAAVAATGLLGTEGAAEDFDRLTRLACRVLGTPVSLVTLIDADSSNFISAAGMPEHLAHVRRVPLSHSICQHAITLGDTFALDDATEDEIFRHHPAVTEMGARAYLGTPFFSEGGQPLGTVCAIDVAPRRWAPEDAQLVRDLAALTVAEIRRRSAEQSVTRVEAEKAQLLEQAARTKAEFLAVMGREVRSPLTAIMGQAQLLLEDGVDGPVREVLQSVHTCATRANEMISGMLQVAALDADRFDLGTTGPIRLSAEILALLNCGADARH